MRTITLSDEQKSQVNPSLAQKQKYFQPNIFTKYFLGGIYQGCPHLRWQTASDEGDQERTKAGTPFKFNVNGKRTKL